MGAVLSPSSNMKFVVVLACLVGLALAQEGKQCNETISAQCPPIDGSEPVFIADPDNCAIYCECSGGDAWEIICAPGTVFDEDLHLCNWPEVVDCGNRPTP